jgi:hypothetical protein
MSKGWYVRKCKNLWYVTIGDNYKESTLNYHCCKRKQDFAIAEAIKESKRQGFYNKLDSDEWLSRKGFSNLIVNTNAS